jgi:hypothetical protein
VQMKEGVVLGIPLFGNHLQKNPEENKSWHNVCLREEGDVLARGWAICICDSGR